MDDLDRIVNHLVAILDGYVFEIDSVFGAVLGAIFYNINGIVLGIAQIDGILVDVTDELSDVPWCGTTLNCKYCKMDEGLGLRV